MSTCTAQGWCLGEPACCRIASSWRGGAGAYGRDRCRAGWTRGPPPSGLLVPWVWVWFGAIEGEATGEQRPRGAVPGGPVAGGTSPRGWLLPCPVLWRAAPRMMARSRVTARRAWQWVGGFDHESAYWADRGNGGFGRSTCSGVLRSYGQGCTVRRVRARCPGPSRQPAANIAHLRSASLVRPLMRLGILVAAEDD